MSDGQSGILVVGGLAEDVRAIDAGVGELGLSVTWLEPQEAMGHLAASAPIAVFLELLPSGLELAHAIRSQDHTRYTPLVFMADPGLPAAEKARAYSFPPADCLMRPLVSADVRQRADLALELRRQSEWATIAGPAGEEFAASLREGESRVANLGDHLPDVVIYQVIQTPQGTRKFTYVSAGITNMFGVRPDEVLADARTLYGLIHPEDLPAVMDAEMQAILTRGRFDCQFRQRSRSGKLRWVRCRSSCRVIGGLTVWDGLLTDETRAHQGAEAHRTSEERFRLLADVAPVLIWMTGPDRQGVWFNRPWLEFTGRTLEQQTGEGWVDPIYPEDRPRWLETLHQAIAERRPVQWEYRLRRHDGVYRWVLVRGVPLAEPGPEIGGYIGSCIDITDRREMEEALRSADRRRDDYLVMLAHELRNPLAPIRNGLHVLSRKSDDPVVVNQVREMMSRQVENMARIVDDLLDVSRVARGKVTIRKSRLDLADVARTCVDDRRSVAEGAGLTLTFTAPEGPIWVDADATRLSQVLDNLIHNAIKFTPAGGSVSVTVRGEGDVAELRVCDTGIGIDHSVLPHMFEVFTQADRSLDRSRGGLGLGLALVKGLVELHQGTVQARSEGVGQGAEFTVRLPRAQEPRALTEIPASPSNSGRRRRVLVVEDNPDSAESLRMLLDLCGFEVEVASTGPDGVAAALRFLPHTVVCDIGLPGMDGYGVARSLRKRPETAAVRLIAVTGYGRTEDIEKARRAGFDYHLTKPVDPNDLLDQLVASR